MTDDDQWQVLFDAAHKQPELQFLVFGLALLIAAALVWWKRTSLRPNGAPPVPDVAAGVLLVMGLIWTGVGAGPLIRGVVYPQAESAVDQSPVTEGLIENFQPLTCHCPGAPESFDVNDVHFAYASAVITQGFSQDFASGGPIRAGLLVRIHYVGDPRSATVVRLEIHR
jgi:hypothetical protein